MYQRIITGCTFVGNIYRSVLRKADMYDMEVNICSQNIPVKRHADDIKSMRRTLHRVCDSGSYAGLELNVEYIKLLQIFGRYKKANNRHILKQFKRF